MINFLLINTLAEFKGGLSPILGKIREDYSVALGRFIRGKCAEWCIFLRADSAGNWTNLSAP